MIQSHIRVEKALAARRSFSQLHREKVRAKPQQESFPYQTTRYKKERAL
jgi:hypothetical protein